MSTLEKEFPYTSADFARIQKLIYAHAGISLSPQKADMAYSRLARRLRQLQISSFRDYLDRLEDDDSEEWQFFINALTTNLTSFFRESHHFDILARQLEQRQAQGRPYTIWCCASSTGEEPYSLAMTAVEALGSFTPGVSILASDLDTNVLQTASRGVYPLERVSKLETSRLRSFFLKGRGERAGFACVRPELQALVQFRQINLLAPEWPVRGPLDAIFCRNVMIYFDRATQRRLLERFAPLLAPDGLLFVGHSESLHHASDLFRLRGNTVYEGVGRRG